MVAGAGVVGLAHAWQAARRGLRVHVVERDHRAVGASIRNFGHICVTGQEGRALSYATAGRPVWLELGRRAGFGVAEAGTVVVARAADELAVLEELADLRSGQVELLSRRGVAGRLAIDHDGVVGGAFLPLDLRVEQRRAVAALARWLEQRPEVSLAWGTSLTGVEAGGVGTTRGPVATSRVVVAVNHDVDRLFPELAAAAGLARCRLRMLQVANPTGATIDPAVLTGTSLLRYPAFANRAAAPAIRSRLAEAGSPLLAEAVNLMFTQLPGGDLVIGDTHHDAATHDPVLDERLDRLLLDEMSALLGAGPLEVRARWTGSYAHGPGEFLVEEVGPGARVVSVTSGIGMTTAFGLADEVIGQLLSAG